MFPSILAASSSELSILYVLIDTIRCLYMACSGFSLLDWIKTVLPNTNRPSSPTLPWGPDIDLDLQYPLPVLQETVGVRNPNQETNRVGYRSPRPISTSLQANLSSRSSDDIIVLPSRPSEDTVESSPGISYNTTQPLPEFRYRDNKKYNW